MMETLTADSSLKRLHLTQVSASKKITYSMKNKWKQTSLLLHCFPTFPKKVDADVIISKSSCECCLKLAFHTKLAAD